MPMAQMNISISAKVKKCIFIGVILLSVSFVIVQFSRKSEFRAAKDALNDYDYARAAELFSELGTFSDSDSYVIYCNALDAFAQADYMTALELFEQISTFQKSSKYILYTKGMIAYQNSQYWEAASYFEKCSKSVLGHSEFLDNLTKAKMCYYTSGWILETTGDYARAITCYRLADDFDDAKTRLKECEEALKNMENADNEENP